MGRKKLDLPKHLQKKGLEEAASLSRALLTKASDRLGGENSAEVLEHPYFASLDKDELDKHKISAPYKPKIGGNTDSSNFRQDGEEMEDEEVEQYFGDSDWCKGFWSSTFLWWCFLYSLMSFFEGTNNMGNWDKKHKNKERARWELFLIAIFSPTIHLSLVS